MFIKNDKLVILWVNLEPPGARSNSCDNENGGMDIDKGEPLSGGAQEKQDTGKNTR